MSENSLLMKRLYTLRAEADLAIIELGGVRKDAPGAQIDRIKDTVQDAINELRAGNVDSADLALQDAIGHCQTEGVDNDDYFESYPKEVRRYRS